jgi:tRNA(adenine34) deaminase
MTGSERAHEAASSSDIDWMQQALALAEKAERMGEVPVGALVVQEGRVLGAGFNTVIADSDPTAHAEIVAVRAASRQTGNYRLPGATLYVTLEPCSMCAGAIVNARIARVVYGARDPRAGAHRSVFHILDHPELNHRCQVSSGILSEECGDILKAFFRKRR